LRLLYGTLVFEDAPKFDPDTLNLGIAATLILQVAEIRKLHVSNIYTSAAKRQHFRGCQGLVFLRVF